MAVEDEFTWNVEMEVGLFHAMRGHKPVGVNKNFHMMCIHEKFHQVTGRKISSKRIWKHLSTMYDMQALDESEILPFPNTQADFLLPQTDFGDLINTKRKDPDRPLARRSSSVSSDESSTSKTDSLKTTFRLSGTAASLIATTTPSEKDNSPKRKRTRAGATPTPSGGGGESAKRRR